MNAKINVFWVVLLSVIIFVARIVPHEANFTPVLALCLLCGFFAQGRWYGFVLPLAALLLSEQHLMSNPSWLLTLSPLFLLVALGTLMKKRLGSVLKVGLTGSLLFFFISNLGVWMFSGLYEMTWLGLKDCFVLAVPFFRMTFVSTMTYLLAVYFTVTNLQKIQNPEVVKSL